MQDFPPLEHISRNAPAVSGHTIAVPSRSRGAAAEQIKEEPIMFCDKANKCIECTVRQCAHHCDDANYCSLDKIRVGTHECDPTVEQCTDCLSFAKK